MDRFPSVALPAVAFFLSFWLTGWLRRYSLDRRLIDVPNLRSSHSVATPRGGGVAIAVATLAALVAAGVLHLLSWPLVWGLAGGGTIAGGVGFVEDHREVPRRWRLLAHVIAAGWVLFCLGGLPSLQILDEPIDPGWMGNGLAVLYLVWLINLTNFMDGIDGIAAVETITTALGGVLLYVVAGAGEGRSLAPLLLASATLGFLVWNWPPARIFMGDSGSGFLGLTLGALSLDAARADPGLFWSWVILMGAFIVDATFTLLCRAIRGERIHEAHRSHAYQHVALRCGAHKPVTIAVAGINLLWLLPIALLVAMHSMAGWAGLLLAYAPLIAAAALLGAGRNRTP